MAITKTIVVNADLKKAQEEFDAFDRSVKATNEYEKSRSKVREFINADKDEEIIYTRNASESLNIIAYTWGSRNVNKDDDIFITPFEHHSNIVPWQELCKNKKVIM